MIMIILMDRRFLFEDFLYQDEKIVLDAWTEQRDILAAATRQVKRDRARLRRSVMRRAHAKRTLKYLTKARRYVMKHAQRRIINHDSVLAQLGSDTEAE